MYIQFQVFIVTLRSCSESWLPCHKPIATPCFGNFRRLSINSIEELPPSRGTTRRKLNDRHCDTHCKSFFSLIKYYSMGILSPLLSQYHQSGFYTVTDPVVEMRMQQTDSGCRNENAANRLRLSEWRMQQTDSGCRNEECSKPTPVVGMRMQQTDSGCWNEECSKPTWLSEWECSKPTAVVEMRMQQTESGCRNEECSKPTWLSEWECSKPNPDVWMRISAANWIRCYRNVGPPEWWSYRPLSLGTVVLGPTILEM